jgi:Hypothetical glycosyl hydrolase family 15
VLGILPLRDKRGRAWLPFFLSFFLFLLLCFFIVLFFFGGGVGGRHSPAADLGRPKYQLDAASYFDRFATPPYAQWMKEHISAIYAYPPFGAHYIELTGLQVVAYHDPATEGQAPLSTTGIKEYVAKVTGDVSLGYAGVYVDDANWSYSPSPGPNAALANLLQAIRAAQPNAKIEINSQYHDIWPLLKSKAPDVERALSVTNVVDKEFGVGPTAQITTSKDYGELFEYIDALHGKGIAVTMAGDYQSNNVPTMEYNLATYFLINDGHDYVSGVNQTPENWWAGFDVNLGNALSPRERSPSGLWTRAFSGGRVYTLEPGAATQTIRLGKPMHSAQWGTTESLTLKAGQGAVLTG